MRKNANLKIRLTMGQPMVHYLSNGDFCTFSFHCIFFFLNENAQLLYFVTFYFILFFLSFIWSTLGSNCSLCTLSYKRAHPFKSGTSLPSSEPLASHPWPFSLIHFFPARTRPGEAGQAHFGRGDIVHHSPGVKYCFHQGARAISEYTQTFVQLQFSLGQWESFSDFPFIPHAK